MDYLLDLLQGAGIALALGVRPLLPVVLVGLLASANLGVDFDDTSFSFLEQPIFLAVVTALGGILLTKPQLTTDKRFVPIVAAVGGALGALEAAGSVDDRSATWWPGIVVGGLCAALSAGVAASLLARVRARLDADTATTLPLYAEAIALLVAGLCVLFPPLAILALAGAVFLAVGSRRREGEKYAGLRILR